VRPVRAIVYGVGAMGRVMARLLIDKGCEIVGAVARSPEKVGRDLGEVAGLGLRTGVAVEADARRALEAGADVAMVSVASYLSVMFEHFRVCLEHGCDVVTIEEETVWPWRTAPELAEELDRIAKAHGATLAASGAQDVFWINLVSVLMGAAHRVDAVSGRCTWNADDYGPEVARHVHLGELPERFESFVAAHGWPDFVARATLEALAVDAGLTPAAVTPSVKPVVADEDVWSTSLGQVIAAGRLLGVVDAVTLHTREGPALSFEMEGRLFREGEVDTNEWVIKGEPELRLLNDRVPTRLITCTSAVNRIPDVIAAPAGLVTLDRLPKPRYKHGPLLVDA
jgi:secondary-alkyl amine dehydrogenase [NAD(P)+]